ncbi:MAG: hypothetical protein AB1631_33490 [Acidobacteriota bacterium]
MSDAAVSIKRFERKVMWRERALSLIDHLAVALVIASLASASIILYIRLRPAELSIWKTILAVFGAVALAAGARWFLTLGGEREAAFKIDRALGLEDRIVSSRAIIEQGGPRREIENALIDDAAQHLSKTHESQVVPFAFARWHAVGLIGVAALVVALMIPQKPNPQAEALIAERQDIQAAAEQMEQTATEVEKELPPETETARLAKEQAELGRALRRSTDTRAEALKKINELEGRIRQRHEALAETRADEIVQLAERRLKSVLAEKPKKQSDPSEDKSISTSEANPSGQNAEDAKAQKKENKADTSNKSETASSNKSDESAKSDEEKSDQSKPTDKTGESNADKKQSDKGGQSTGGRSGNQTSNQGKSQGEASGEKSSQQKTEGEKSESEKSDSEKPEGEKSEGEKSESEKPEGEKKESIKPPDAMSRLMAEQAAKALSNQLLKKAEQLRAGDLKPEDIKKLQQAAENLARDLAPIAQSNEFQQLLEQLAQKVDPEQLEQVARELMKNEQLKKELEAAARMLAENRQVKEMVAGLRKNFGEVQRGEAKERGRDQFRQGDGTGKGRSDSKLGMSAPREELKGQGKEKQLAGRMQRKPGGEYLFLQARPGAGAARAPYSSAYPQYRREAERAVERSRVPARMRSMVKNYFDVINPDAEKKP